MCASDQSGPHCCILTRALIWSCFGVSDFVPRGVHERMLVNEFCEHRSQKRQGSIPHQANRRIIDAAAKRCGLEQEQVLVNINKYGNTTAGTIPIALDEAVEKGRLENGDLLLLAAFGGGFTWGSMLIKWGN